MIERVVAFVLCSFIGLLIVSVTLALVKFAPVYVR